MIWRRAQLGFIAIASLVVGGLAMWLLGYGDLLIAFILGLGVGVIGKMIMDRRHNE